MATKSPLSNHLERASAAIDANDFGAATTELVVAWRAAHVDRIADLVLHLGSRLPPPEPFKGASVMDREKAWLDLARKRQPETLARLLAHEWPLHARGARVRLEQLEKLDPDPRIVRSLADLWKTGRIRGLAGSRFWRAALELVYGWSVPDLHVLFEGMDGIASRAPIAAPTVDEEAEALLDEIASKLLIPSKTQKADRQKKRQALFDAVYESPADDAPRLVLADFLLEEGDARGAFIPLDIRLAAEGKLPQSLAREHKALLRNGQKIWTTGFLDDKLFGIELGRGFPALATLERRSFLDPGANRAHRTLVSLRFIETPAEHASIPLPLPENLVSIRELLNVEPRLLAALALHGGGRAFDHLSLSEYEPSWRGLDLTPAPALSVRKLTVINALVIDEVLARSDFVARAGVEELSFRWEQLERVTGILRSTLPKLPKAISHVEVRLRDEHWTLQLRRADLGGKLPSDRWNLESRWVATPNRIPAQSTLDALARLAEEETIAEATMIAPRAKTKSA